MSFIRASARLGLALSLGLLLLAPATSKAAPESARLLPPAAEAGGVADNPMRWMALELASGAGAALVAVPATLALSAWVGSLSHELGMAAAPAMLLLLALPPLVVTGVQWAVGNWLRPGSARLQPAVWVSLGVHALVVTGAVLLGATVHNLGDAALFTLVEVLLLPTASALTMRATAPAVLASPARTLERPRSVVEATSTRMLVVPLLSHAF